MSSPRYVLGIDLGTTNTVCAAWLDTPGAKPFVCDIRQPYSDPDVVPPSPVLPSVVAFTPAHGVLVGHYAKDQYARTQGERTVGSVKRHMGSRWTKAVGEQVWTPEQVSGFILKAVRVGVSGVPKGKPAWVVITVPACFGTEQRRATLDAARLAGFEADKISLFDEPVAALLHQSWEEGAAWEEARRLLILDVGGGTLDASYMVVRREGDTLHADVQGRSRYNELGGDDIDLNLAGLMLHKLLKNPKLALADLGRKERAKEHRDLCSELLYRAEKAKVELCKAVKDAQLQGVDKQKTLVEVLLSYVPGRRDFPLQVSLQDLSDAVREFMPDPHQPADAGRFHYSFNAALDQALKSADKVSDTHPPAVDLMYLTGGSSRLPMLRPAVNYFLRESGYSDVPMTVVGEPMNAVALGAARYAGTLAKFPTERVALRERMFEGVYFRTDDGPPRVLIPPMSDISKKETFEQTVPTRGPGTRAELDLFTGTGDGDPDMQPLRKRSLSFTEVLPPDHEVHFTATVTPDRQVKLTCWTDLNGRRLTGKAEVRAVRLADGGVLQHGLDWVPEDDDDGQGLPDVNPAAADPAEGGGA